MPPCALWFFRFCYYHFRNCTLSIAKVAEGCVGSEMTAQEDRGKNSTLQPGFSPADRAVFLEHHTPSSWTNKYHVHPSIEINFLDNCHMTYSFAAKEVQIPQGRFCIFGLLTRIRSRRLTATGKLPMRMSRSQSSSAGRSPKSWHPGCLTVQ